MAVLKHFVAKLQCHVSEREPTRGHSGNHAACSQYEDAPHRPVVSGYIFVMRYLIFTNVRARALWFHFLQTQKFMNNNAISNLFK